MGPLGTIEVGLGAVIAPPRGDEPAPGPPPGIGRRRQALGLEPPGVEPHPAVVEAPGWLEEVPAHQPLARRYAGQAGGVQPGELADAGQRALGIGHQVLETAQEEAAGGDPGAEKEGDQHVLGRPGGHGHTRPVPASVGLGSAAARTLISPPVPHQVHHPHVVAAVVDEGGRPAHILGGVDEGMAPGGGGDAGEHDVGDARVVGPAPGGGDRPVSPAFLERLPADGPEDGQVAVGGERRHRRSAGAARCRRLAAIAGRGRLEAVKTSNLAETVGPRSIAQDGLEQGGPAVLGAHQVDDAEWVGDGHGPPAPAGWGS